MSLGPAEIRRAHLAPHTLASHLAVEIHSSSVLSDVPPARVFCARVFAIAVVSPLALGIGAEPGILHIVNAGAAAAVPFEEQDRSCACSHAAHGDFPAWRLLASPAIPSTGQRDSPSSSDGRYRYAISRHGTGT